MKEVDIMGDYTGQWAILPARVRYDRSLPANAKLIYAEIAAKINECGYCFCYNQHFSDRFGLKPDTVSALIKKLEDAEYIRVDVDKSRVNSDRRRIFLTAKPYDFSEMGGPGKKSDTPAQGIGFKSDTVPEKNPIPIENNNLKTNTPYNPPEGDGAAGKKKTKDRSQPGWKPERFEGFYEFYPVHKNRVAAVRAWDKLRPSDELINTIARALKAQKASDDWQRGIGIPHPATWLNGQRWKDETAPSAAGAAVTAGPEEGDLEEWT